VGKPGDHWPPYAHQPLPAAQMQRKAAEFGRLRADYERMRDSQWNGDKRYDARVFAPLTTPAYCPSACTTNGCQRLRRCSSGRAGLGCVL